MTYRKQIAETIIETDNNCENLNDKIISRENLLGHIDSKKGRTREYLYNQGGDWKKCPMWKKGLGLSEMISQKCPIKLHVADIFCDI